MKIHESLALIAITFFLALLMIKPSIRIATRLNIMDRPNSAHKTHKVPIPYLGGISIMFAMLISFLIYKLIFESDFSEIYLLSTLLILMPGFFLGVIGLIDDISGLSTSIRIVIQTITSVVVAILIVQGEIISQLSSIQIFNWIITVGFFVAITNAFNLIDNIDGGASSIGIITGITIFTLAQSNGQSEVAIAALTLSSSIAAFLLYNWSPAQIYLGDSGSLMIGLLLAILALKLDFFSKDLISNLATVIAIFAFPTLDTTVVVMSRIARRTSPLVGGRDHISHRLLNLGYSVRKAVIIQNLIAIVFSSLALLIQKGSSQYLSFLNLLTLTLFLTLYLKFIRLKF
jgi:UDP-GlcNAc:undecaprenyl-phosphate GlcNAc-1-phosphate transferase